MSLSRIVCNMKVLIVVFFKVKSMLNYRDLVRPQVEELEVLEPRERAGGDGGEEVQGEVKLDQVGEV